ALAVSERVLDMVVRVGCERLHPFESRLPQFLDRVHGAVEVLVGGEDALARRTHQWASLCCLFRRGAGSTSLSSWIAMGGRMRVKSRNQNPNQKKLPTMIIISVTDGR